MKSIRESIIGRKGSRNIKQSLRNGDVVEIRQGIYSIYIQDENGFLSGFGPGRTICVTNRLQGWDENLISLNPLDDWDVVKIYHKPTNKTFYRKSSFKKLNEYVEWIIDNVNPIVINQ